MSYVDVVILGHLAKETCHGYALRRQVEASTGFGLHNNALYPALHRFEEAGAVTKTAQPQAGGRPPRLVYAITELGREMLHDLLADLPAAQAGDDAEFLARLGQFELLTPAERRTVLDARLTALDARVAHLAGLTDASRGHPWGAVVVAEMGRRTAADHAWVTRLLAADGELPPPDK
jgi:DNA-binding PadR family transcriptional regulator